MLDDNGFENSIDQSLLNPDELADVIDAFCSRKGRL